MLSSLRGEVVLYAPVPCDFLPQPLGAGDRAPNIAAGDQENRVGEESAHQRELVPEVGALVEQAGAPPPTLVHVQLGEAGAHLLLTTGHGLGDGGRAMNAGQAGRSDLQSGQLVPLLRQLEAGVDHLRMIPQAAAEVRGAAAHRAHQEDGPAEG